MLVTKYNNEQGTLDKIVLTAENLAEQDKLAELTIEFENEKKNPQAPPAEEGFHVEEGSQGEFELWRGEELMSTWFTQEDAQRAKGAAEIVTPPASDFKE